VPDASPRDSQHRRLVRLPSVRGEVPSRLHLAGPAGYAARLDTARRMPHAAPAQGYVLDWRRHGYRLATPRLPMVRERPHGYARRARTSPSRSAVGRRRAAHARSQRPKQRGESPTPRVRSPATRPSTTASGWSTKGSGPRLLQGVIPIWVRTRRPNTRHRHRAPKGTKANPENHSYMR
jgi:hypothetical protein